MSEEFTSGLSSQPHAGTPPEKGQRIFGRVSTFWLWLIILGILTSAWLSSLAFGSVSIPLSEVVGILAGKIASHPSWSAIVLDFRLPKSLTAILAGASLAVAGLQMQTLFRNPLADPYVLGISSGASMGVALVVLTVGGSGWQFLSGLSSLGDVSVITAASLGAMLVLALIMLLARRVHTVTLLILGVMVGYLASAMVRILIHFSLPERVQVYLAWTFGSFGGVSWEQMIVFAPAVGIGLALAFLTLKPLNALLLGETYARSMGISIRRTRWLIIISASLLAGSVTAFCGLVGFIGIAVPHLCRSLFRDSNHRRIMPACVIVGGAVALLADLLTQLPGSAAILPLNSVTALIGAPVVIWVILKQRNLRGVLQG